MKFSQKKGGVFGGKTGDFMGFRTFFAGPQKKDWTKRTPNANILTMFIVNHIQVIRNIGKRIFRLYRSGCGTPFQFLVYCKHGPELFLTISARVPDREVDLVEVLRKLRAA